ncbi:MAG: hypothetical protein DI605_17195 [Sphingomonas sp.]|nr:MAG: hypothetical protein DI605_17195 [Sphingomonas sp.]
MTSFTFGEIGEGSVLRGGLSFSTTLSAGMHDLAIEAVRVFETRPSTPYQYVTGITLAGEVPEPTGWAMMIAGFGLIGARLRRVHSAASASSASACWRFHISA